MHVTLKGIIISETDFSEYDKYIDILTYNHGKVSVFCKGVRRKNAVLSNKTRLFAFGEFEVFKNRSKYILNDVIIIDRFFEITEDIEHFALCSYFVQITSKLCDSDIISIEITRTLISSLYAICKTKKDPLLVKTAIELRMMSLSGFMPQINSCGICGEKPSTLSFDLMNGILCCNECSLDNSNKIMLTTGVLRSLYHIITCDLDKLYSFSVSEKSFEILCNLTENYLLIQTDYNFKALDFYKSMIATTL